MKYDELAFINRQLAGLLNSGIPLEGSLRQLSATMRSSSLRTELQELEADLAQGTPIERALESRRLPEFYVQMLRVGVRANNLPGVLTLLADYYEKLHTIWTRLTGLMVYPLLVLAMALVLSGVVSFIYESLVSNFSSYAYGQPPLLLLANLLFPPVLLAVLLVGLLVALALPSVRRNLRWRLPGFKEASLAQAASTVELMLKNGNNLNDSLGVLQHLEEETPAGKELFRWQTRLANGESKFEQITQGARIFPPLFVWLVASAGENMSSGFRQAAEIYYTRAQHKIDMFLYAALPVSIMLLGVMIVGQVVPLMGVLSMVMNSLGTMGD